MSANTATTPPPKPLNGNLPLWQLIHPRQRTKEVLLALAIGLVLGWGAVLFLQQPAWMATLIVLVTLLPVGILQWRDDLHRNGWVVMLLSIVVVSQGIHSIEHFVQWGQYHVLYWTSRQSNGLLSAANAEWVHFAWNWAVLLVVLFLIKGGMRNFWTYLLLAVAIGHTIEHTYMFFRHLQVLSELRGLGVTLLTAQGLPGICGRDGWLARSEFTRGTFLANIPGITTAIRLDVHFWWNAIEITLLLLAGHFYLRKRFARRPSVDRKVDQALPGVNQPVQ